MQRGICPVCKQRLHREDELDIHHRKMKVKGGKDTLNNLALLDGICHRHLHATKQENVSLCEQDSSVGAERCLMRARAVGLETYMAGSKGSE